MKCYVPNKTTDVPLSVTNNCMPNALRRGTVFDVKNDEKARCRALHAFLGLFLVILLKFGSFPKYQNDIICVIATSCLPS